MVILSGYVAASVGEVRRGKVAKVVVMVKKVLFGEEKKIRP